MYAALWRVLPGPTWLKIVELLGLAVILLGALVFGAFPVVADVFFSEESSVGEQ